VRHTAFVDDKTWAKWGPCRRPLSPDGTQPPPEHPCALGQLTPLGELQLTDTGRWFRERFVDGVGLLDKKYNSKQLLIRSTDFPRTILSAQCLLRGLYPDIEESDVAKAVNRIRGRYTPNPGSCPRLAEIWAHLKTTPEYTSPLQTKSVLAARRELNALIGVEPEATLPTWLEVSDSFQCLEASDIPIPSKISAPIIALTLRLALLEFWRLVSHNRETIQFTTGLLLKEVLQAMENVVHQKPAFTSPVDGDGVPDIPVETRGLVYSLHDSTLVPLLKVLDLYDGEWPSFAANVTFELVYDPSTSTPRATSFSATLSSSSLDQKIARLESQLDTKSPNYGWYVRIWLNKKPKVLITYSEFQRAVAPFTLSGYQDYLDKCNAPGKGPIPTFQW